MNENWAQILTIIIANFGVVWWFRKESREDWKMIHQEMREFKESVRMDMNNFNEKLLKIDKDFHERLLEIEVKRGKSHE